MPPVDRERYGGGEKVGVGLGLRLWLTDVQTIRLEDRAVMARATNRMGKVEEKPGDEGRENRLTEM